MNLKFKGRVSDDGVNVRLYPVDKERLSKRLLKLKGKDINFTLNQFREGRSYQQNRYYWGVIIEIIAEECGYNQQWEKEELHNELKRQFLPKHGKLQISTSSSELNTKEFEDYVSKIRQWSSTFLQTYIPDPNEIEI